MAKEKGEPAHDDRFEIRTRAALRDLDEIRPIEEEAGVGENALLHMTPKMRLGLVRIVHEDITAAGPGDLLAPALELSTQLRHATRAEQLDRHDRVDRAHIRRDALPLVNETQAADETVMRARVIERDPELRESPNATGMPESAARE